MKRGLKLFGKILLVIIIILLINFIPAFRKQDSQMVLRENEYFSFYYNETDEGAEDVYDLALNETPRIIDALRLDEVDKLNIYLYEDQTQMQSKYIGLVAYVADLPWFIGGAAQSNIVMVSPETPNEQHDYDSILETILHEIGHAYNYQLNSNMNLWLDEGMAMVLAGQGDDHTPKDGIGMVIPTHTEINQVTTLNFHKINGYFYARQYADYLIDTYGYDTWLQLITTNDYQTTYNKSQEDIYNEWHEYILEAQNN